MKPRSVLTVPAGKRPKLKNQPGCFEPILGLVMRLNAGIRRRGIKASFFVMASAFFLIAALLLYSHLSHYVYVVILDDREIGAVKNPEPVENLISELNERIYDYYGMAVQPGNKIKMIKDYRPGAVPDTDPVLEIIRQELVYLTDAYLVLIDDVPLVAVASQETLEEAIALLEDTYRNENNDSKILDVSIVEDLSLQPCSAGPNDIYCREKVLSLLLNDEIEESIEPAYWSQTDGRVLAGHHQPFLNPARISGTPAFSGEGRVVAPAGEVTYNAGVNVRSIEELVVTETIPFDIETIDDQKMWVVQNEITSPGREGIKELVYHIIRKNGTEVERSLVGETIIEEPVTQVETRGTAQVPSKGTGQFIWPVEGGGEVTPGRGFSSWHTGIDIDAKAGTKVLAADNGVVWFSGYGGSQGNYIIIYHGHYWTLYLHNQTNLVGKGDKVSKGDVIARVGSTGRSTGSHLHFEVRRDDGSGEWLAYYQHQPVDPLRFFRP